MGRVKVLDANLIEKIAAGEVIERPASVVKELIENSLDAEASRIEIAIERGGIKKIVVSDDGSGMLPEDLELAVRRHTTSKISDERDLERITTLGFRGEALAAIVEVSKATITTRAREAAEAVKLEVNGGVARGLEPAARAPGTTVEAADLFYNTPARRKYLRSVRTEAQQVIRTVKRFALAWPEVHFKLVSDDRVIFDLPPVRELRERLASLYNPALARALIAVEAAGPVRISGLIGPPELARIDRGEQFLFVNRRYIRDQGLSYAVARAYGNLLKDKAPVFFLFLELEPGELDVNVHPRKEEVRFAEPGLVQGLVRRAVQAALLSKQAIPSLEAPPGRRPRRREARPAPAELELDLKRELTALRRGQEPPVPMPAPPPPRAAEEFRVLGQLHHTYILVETPEGLELIDQHVAHERVLYEQFLEQLNSSKVARQRLLFPLTVELPPEALELLLARVEWLREHLGIAVEEFGGGSLIVREWPQVLAEHLNPESAHEVLEKVALHLRDRDDESLEFTALAERLATELACAAALKKNTPLTSEEMEALVRQLKETKNPYRCPHGRPIIIKYTLKDLERRFGRH